MRIVGLDAEAIFEHPEIVPWRKLPDRENCTLDAQLDGKPVRLHVKRYLTTSNGAADEIRGIDLLRSAEIPTVPLVGWGTLSDGRSFVITEDLAGFRDSEKLVRERMPFDLLIGPTSELAAKLHDAGLHHRDLYLCHFFSRAAGDRSSEVEVRLIDAARVDRMRSVLTRWRWVVKDLAQFWYSTTQIETITDAQRDEWLRRYAERRKLCCLPRLRAAVMRKAAWIARHDAKLKQSQPDRNISIPH
jgi:hypothetical protein